MAFLLLVGVIATGVLAYARTAYSSTESYRVQRDERYAGDGAINAAINWARNNPNVARDPDLGFTDDEPCIYTLPAADGNPEITVTCAAEPGSGSGQPTDTGLVPDQAMVLLGQRYGEVPRHSPCGGEEVGIRFNQSAPVSGRPTCEPAGPIGDMHVVGDIHANAPIAIDDGHLVVDGEVVAGTSRRFDYQPCTPGRVDAVCQPLPTVHPRDSQNGPASSPWDPGETLVTDPRLADPDAWPRGEINWNPGRVAVNDGAPVALNSGTLTGIRSACSAATGDTPKVIRFFPGWYNDAAVLTSLFNSPECSNGVFWFQPAPGDLEDNPTQAPLTEHSKQGVYLFDFRNGGGATPCGRYENTNYPHRWCLSLPAEEGTGPKVVAGWPKNWEPGSATSTVTSTHTLEMTRAGTIQGEWLSGWTNQSGAAEIGDGQHSTYSTWLPSFSDRRLTLSNFQPQVATGGGNREVSISVRHREQGTTHQGQIWMRLRSRQSDGSFIDCGNFYVSQSQDWTTDTFSTSDPSLDPSERSRLADCFLTAQRANNLEVRWQVEGSWNLFSGMSAQLDGIRISVESPVDQWFDDTVERPAIYCDDSKPGAQFVFGGDSTMHAGGAVFHICAGPTDEEPQQHQQIAIWGEPGLDSANTRVVSLKPSVIERRGSDGTITNASRATSPGDPYVGPGNERPHARVSVPWALLWDTSTELGFRGFQDVGTGSCGSVEICLGDDFGIAKVELKVGYATACGGAFFGDLLEICGDWQANPSIGLRSDSSFGGEYCANDSVFPGVRGSGPLWFTYDVTSCLGLGPEGRNVGALNDLAVRWTQHCNVCVEGGPSGNVQGRYEGVELLVTVKARTPARQVVVPATGCRNSAGTGFSAGSGDPTVPWDDDIAGRDCALISGGRVAVMGTIYAPSDALEISDGSALYPFADRGMVARHLRVRRYQTGSGYDGPAFSNELDLTPTHRDSVFVACVRSTPSSAACGEEAGDRVLSQARVILNNEDVPTVEWWVSDR